MTSARKNGAQQPQDVSAAPRSRKAGSRLGSSSMRVIDIEIAKLVIEDRERPVDPQAVEALAVDIGERGLGAPIHVAETDRGPGIFRLVAGAHRVAAHQLLKMTHIPGVVRGHERDIDALKEAEVLENLARNDLSALDRALHTARFKAIYQARTGAKRGGDRRSAEATKAATLQVWYARVAMTAERSPDTVERQARIGEKLSQKAVARLHGTPYAQNQQGLEILAAVAPSEQLRLIDTALNAEEPLPTIKAAQQKLQVGKAKSERDPLQGLKNAWRKATGPTREAFLAWIEEQDDS